MCASAAVHGVIVTRSPERSIGRMLAPVTVIRAERPRPSTASSTLGSKAAPGARCCSWPTSDGLEGLAGRARVEGEPQGVRRMSGEDALARVEARGEETGVEPGQRCDTQQVRERLARAEGGRALARAIDEGDRRERHGSGPRDARIRVVHPARGVHGELPRFS